MEDNNSEIDINASKPGGNMRKNIFVVLAILILIFLALVIAFWALGKTGMGIPFMPNKAGQESSNDQIKEQSEDKDSRDKNKSNIDQSTSNFKPIQDKKNGYTIIWKEEKDTTGRTILYENNANTTAEQLVAGRLNGSGEVFDVIPSTPKHIAGTFVRFEPTNSKEEIIMILKNPVTNEILPKIILSLKTLGTRLAVEDVDYGPSNPIPDYSFQAELAGFVGDYPNLEKFIRYGDAIVALMPNEVVKSSTYKTSAIFLRRYGGKLAFQAEIK